MGTEVKIMSDTPRFQAVTRESLSAEGQRVWDKRANAVNAPTGHFNVMMRSPALHERVHDLEQFFRSDSVINEQEREFITLVVAREAQARFAWGRHEIRAKERGVSAEAIESVRARAALEAFDPAHRLMVELARTLAGAREPLPEELFNRVKAAKGERWTIEAVALVAHYTLVSVLIHGYAVQPRPDDKPTF